jgi:ribosome-associated protein
MDDDKQFTISEKLSIPRNELQFRFSTSRGPGGQHANRSASRVTLLFDVYGSPSLSEQQRSILIQNLGNRMDQNGVLRIEAQESRSQHKNRQVALERFRTLVSTAVVERKKRQSTKPSLAAKERRLANKKKKSDVKRDRASTWRDDA